MTFRREKLLKFLGQVALKRYSFISFVLHAHISQQNLVLLTSIYVHSSYLELGKICSCNSNI